MAPYRSCVACVFLCIVYAVISVKIRATIQKDFNVNERATKVVVSEYINGANYENTTSLTLDRLVLVDGETLPTLTLTNFKSLLSLNIINIPIEYVPVFENISTVYISITGTKIKYVQTNAFDGALVRVIHLEKNEIQSMSVGSVNVDVQHVTLRCNKLSEFSPAWFKNPSGIRKLYLSGNRIAYIQHHAFKQMTQLDVLYLNNNHLSRIGSEAFGSGITHLHLQFNNIELLTADMFAGRDIRIDSLFLHHNQLSFLSEALLVKLKLKHLSLDGNPWQCQCLRDIERWLREQNITRYHMRDRSGEPVCVVPLSFQNVCVPTVDKELQQTYARGLSPVQECLATACGLHSHGSCSYFGLNIISG